MIPRPRRKLNLRRSINCPFHNRRFGGGDQFIVESEAVCAQLSSWFESRLGPHLTASSQRNRNWRQTGLYFLSVFVARITTCFLVELKKCEIVLVMIFTQRLDHKCKPITQDFSLSCIQAENLAFEIKVCAAIFTHFTARLHGNIVKIKFFHFKVSNTDQLYTAPDPTVTWPKS